jgi:ATP-dependent Clp protease ATP-binding subunit ClpB
MTSNLGSQFMQESDESRKKELIMDVVRHTFKPEFLNRVDEIVLFNNLGLDQIKVIVDIQLALLERRLADRKLSIAITDAAREFIVKHGYDPVYGARPLKRAIQRYIQDSLALKILEGEFKEGDTVSIDYDRTSNTLRFETAGKKRSAKAV